MDFFSRRNHVSLVCHHGLQCVRKEFSCEADCRKEVEFYQKMKGKLPMPEIWEVFPDILLMEYLPYGTFYDLLREQEESGYLEYPWVRLIRWLEICKKESGLLPADGNLRNFIWDSKGNRVFGIDFEQYGKVSLPECLADLCVQIENYDPKGSRLEQQIVRLLKNEMRVMGFDICDINSFMEDAGNRLRKRREKFRT